MNHASPRAGIPFSNTLKDSQAIRPAPAHRGSPAEPRMCRMAVAGPANRTDVLAEIAQHCVFSGRVLHSSQGKWA